MIEKRPWGSFEILESNTDYWVKKITVLPEKRLSVQYHYQRTEEWVVVRGKGTVELNGEIIDIKIGSTIHINKQDIHRITNTDKYRPLIFIEVALGNPKEDDIVRIEDDWNRT